MAGSDPAMVATDPAMAIAIARRRVSFGFMGLLSTEVRYE
jgi:hypothetical protein